MSLGVLLLIVLIVALLGGFHSDLGYSRSWGGGGGLGLVIVIVLVLVLLGKI